jgi:hypothetical protein
MASIEENRHTWDTTYDWPKAGDEWSAHWGWPYAQWEGCLFPHIFPFLKGRILEIAPDTADGPNFSKFNAHR